MNIKNRKINKKRAQILLLKMKNNAQKIICSLNNKYFDSITKIGLEIKELILTSSINFMQLPKQAFLNYTLNRIYINLICIIIIKIIEQIANAPPI